MADEVVTHPEPEAVIAERKRAADTEAAERERAANKTAAAKRRAAEAAQHASNALVLTMFP